MLTNEALFETQTSPGDGFKLPEFPVTPNEIISDTTGVYYESEASENSLIVE